MLQKLALSGLGYRLRLLFEDQTKLTGSLMHYFFITYCRCEDVINIRWK